MPKQKGLGEGSRLEVNKDRGINTVSQSGFLGIALR